MTIPEYLAKVAKGSDDPDTQTACILVTRDEKIVWAANGVPWGVRPTPERTTRPAKYEFIGHAERRAIAKAAKNGIETQGATAYLNWFPCAPCAGSLIDAGIICLFADRAKYEARKDDPRYGFAEAMEMLTEAGVTINWL